MAPMPLLILIPLIAMPAFIACNKEKKVEAERLVNIKTSLAEKKQIQPYLETTGTLKAQERIIKTGNKYGEDVEVVEGLKEKEQVVVVGQNNLSEGVKVNVAR